MTLISILRNGFAILLNNVISAISVEHAGVIFDYIKLLIYFSIINIPLRLINIPLQLLEGIIGEDSPVTKIILIIINILYIYVIKFVLDKIKELLNDEAIIPDGFIKDLLDPVIQPLVNIINRTISLNVDEVILTTYILFLIKSFS